MGWLSSMGSVVVVYGFSGFMACGIFLGLNPCLLHGHAKCLLSHFSHVWLFTTLWTATRQPPLSMESPRQEYWSGLPFPSPGDLPGSGIEPASLMPPTWASLSLSAALSQFLNVEGWGTAGCSKRRKMKHNDFNWSCRLSWVSEASSFPTLLTCGGPH